MRVKPIDLLGKKNLPVEHFDNESILLISLMEKVFFSGLVKIRLTYDKV